ncbi:unnamed protein product, partial [Vitis vinifera]
MRWDCGFCKTLAWLDLLFLFCVFFSVYGRVFSGEVVSEREILLEFKSSVSDPYGVLSSWSSENLDHCSWAGISCDSNSRFPFHGFGIRRDCFNGSGRLVGELSPVVSKLTELRIFSLPFHEFSGEIPNEIWGLEKLEVLDLEGNAFTGNLPGEFSGLRKLQVLNLGFNIIAGEIPFSLSNCVNLRILNLAGNEVNGRIPGFIGSFPKLQGLYLSHNGMIGTVPSLGNCRRLRTLLLFSNKFDDVIPRELGRLRKLEVLDFDTADDKNHFQGSIPMEITTLPKLRLLWAPRATLEGKFPSNWGTCSSLEMQTEYAFLAGGNRLFGSFPGNFFGQCNRLNGLLVNVSDNRISGVLETGTICRSLKFLDVSKNQISGSIPRGLGDLQSLIVLDLSGNKLQGQIPFF